MHRRGNVPHHDIESAWKHSQVVLVLAIDISRFFDNVNHKRLVRIVYKMGFPLPVDGDLSQPRLIAVGIPQGSPISPVLSVIYAAEVITSLKEANICTPSGIPLSPRSYVDGYAIMAVSNSLCSRHPRSHWDDVRHNQTQPPALHAPPLGQEVPLPGGGRVW